MQAVRRMLLFGMQSDARTLQEVPAVRTVLPSLLQALQALLAHHTLKAHPRSQLAVMLDRGIIKLAKTIGNIQDTHPWCVLDVQFACSWQR